MSRAVVLALLLASSLVSGSALAAGTSSARTDITTMIQQPASITTSQDLVLATVLAPPIVTPAPTPSLATVGLQAVSGGLIATSTPTATQATFIVAGQDGQSISVAVPQNFDVTRSGGDERLSVATTNDLSSLTGSQLLTSSVGGAGTLSFNVGGRVNVGANFIPGEYEGLLVVTAQYN